MAKARPIVLGLLIAGLATVLFGCGSSSSDDVGSPAVTTKPATFKGMEGSGVAGAGGGPASGEGQQRQGAAPPPGLK
jgi:hypothetical protein